MIHTRSYLLLERDFKEYEKDNLFGIFITPVGDNLMEWLAEIKGLKDSLWEGAELQLSMKYTERYDAVPPSVNFTTIPFHPNVDPHSGRPCVDFLDDPTMWNPKLTMSSILLSIQGFLTHFHSRNMEIFFQVLLSNPVLNNAVNLQAAKMLQNNYALYRQRVLQCVRASQHLEDITSTMNASATTVKCHCSPEEPSPELARMITTISYENYYMAWTKIATSKTAEHFLSPVFEDPDFIGNSYDWMATNVAKDEWNQNMYHFVSDFIEKQKKIKLLRREEDKHHTPSPTPESTSFVPSEMFAEHQEESWEKEVDELVLWSTNLDEGSWD